MLNVLRSIERRIGRRFTAPEPLPVTQSLSVVETPPVAMEAPKEETIALVPDRTDSILTRNELDPNWLKGKPSYILRFVLEVSGECNLRCVYCPQVGENFVPAKPLSDEMFEEILEYLKRHPVTEMDLTGTGDISMAPNWASKCEQLLALGIKLAVTMNFGTILTDYEVEVLSKFMEISVSLDTLDRKILNTVRKAVDVRTIVYNVMRIRSAERRNNTNVRWVVSAVYTAEIVERLPELASFAVAMAANRFQIQDLIEFNEYRIEKKVTDVWTLTGEKAIAAVDATMSAIDLAKRSGLNILMPPHFDERLDKLREAAIAKRNWSEMAQTPGKFFSTFSAPPEKGYTRDCLDPWTFVHVMTDGRIRPCCISNLSIGKMQKSQGGMEAALNSEVAVELRKKLLTGELDELCTACSLRPVIDIASYQKKVRDMTSSDATP